MEKILINNENLIIYYGNKAGYIKDDQAVIDPMFQNEELVDFLTKENRFNISWKEGVFDALIHNSAADAMGLKACRIHQLKPEVDARMKFISYDELIMRGFGKPNPENYQVVFDGELDTNDLDAIYEKFNMEHPSDYKGHSLTTSDVIEIYDDQESSFHYVNSIGFKDIEFTKPPQEQCHTKKETSRGSEHTANGSESQMESSSEKELMLPDQDTEQEIYTFTL